MVFHREGPPDNSAVKPIGKVDANGEFHLTTKEANDGASPGEYRVTVTWYVSAPIGKRSAEGDELPPRNLVPEKYTRYDATPLRATVSVEPTDPVTIEIKKK